MSGFVIDTWQARPDTAGQAIVLPDGCRDLIVRIEPGGAPDWFVSDLPVSVEIVPFGAGVWMKGFRLQAGTRIDRRLTAEVARIAPDDDTALQALLADMCVRSADVAEALDALCDSPSVAIAARRLRVAPRTLQRLVVRETGMSPLYFQRLARVRRAGRAVAYGETLAGIAASHGFADQAHFSRECRQWFGITPKALSLRPDVVAMLGLPAYG